MKRLLVLAALAAAGLVLLRRHPAGWCHTCGAPLGPDGVCAFSFPELDDAPPPER